MKVPDYLYKYMNSNTAKIVLESQKLRWSCPKTFNDLNELQRMPSFSTSTDDGKEEYLDTLLDIAFGELTLGKPLSQDSSMLLEILKSYILPGDTKTSLKRELMRLKVVIPDLSTMLREVTDNYNDGTLRIMCLSEDNNNEVMWAHYGDNHTGCMLEFQHIQEPESPFLLAKKVHYSDCISSVGSFIDFLLYDERPQILDSTVNSIIYTKTAKWSYEQEWRVMTKRENELGSYNDFIFEKEELVSITFAARIDDEIQNELTVFLKDNYPNCILYKVFVTNGNFERKRIDG